MKHRMFFLFGVLFLWLNAGVNASGDELVSDTNRITISPLFFGPPTHEYPFEEKMTEEKLSRILDNMKNDGIETVLLVGNSGEKTYYPSEILKEPSKKDWYAITFEMALERNMQVGLSGVSYTFENQFTGGTWDPKLDLEVNKKVFRELYERYGHNSNFWGWYIPHETGDRIHRGDIMVILKELPRFLKELTPDKKVSYSPWFPSRITLGEAEALSPAQTAAEWDTILCQVEGIDIYVFQDSTAPLDELGDYFAAIKPVFEKCQKSKLIFLSRVSPGKRTKAIDFGQIGLTPRLIYSVCPCSWGIFPT